MKKLVLIFLFFIGFLVLIPTSAGAYYFDGNNFPNSCPSSCNTPYPGTCAKCGNTCPCCCGSNCSGDCCGGAGVWEKYDASCRLHDSYTGECRWVWVYDTTVCSIGDKCISGETGLRSGQCDCSYGGIYKYCCDSAGNPESCQSWPAYDDGRFPAEGKCPGGYEIDGNRVRSTPCAPPAPTPTLPPGVTPPPGATPTPTGPPPPNRRCALDIVGDTHQVGDAVQLDVFQRSGCENTYYRYLENIMVEWGPRGGQTDPGCERVGRYSMNGEIGQTKSCYWDTSGWPPGTYALKVYYPGFSRNPPASWCDSPPDSCLDILTLTAIPPNCSNLSGPPTLLMGQPGTYSASFYSPQGQLRGRIGEGNFKIFVDETTPGNNLTAQGTWSSDTLGNYLLSCRAWNDGIAECRFADHVTGPPIYACEGPTNSLVVSVVGGNIMGQVYENSSGQCSGYIAPSDLDWSVTCQALNLWDDPVPAIKLGSSNRRYQCQDSSGSTELPYGLYKIDLVLPEGWQVNSQGDCQLSPARVALDEPTKIVPNFYISAGAEAWFQTEGGDVHAQGSFNDPIPTGSYCSLLGSGGFPGVITAGSLGSDPFGDGSASPDPFNWRATTISAETYRYKFFESLINEAESLDGSPSESQLNALDGFYQVSGDLTLPAAVWNINNPNQKVVILVPGSLTIKERVNLGTNNNFLGFIVQGDITVEGNVTSAGVNPTLEGVYIADGTFTTRPSDKKFTGRGMFIAGSFSLNRDLEADNSNVPAEKFIYRPDLWIAAPLEIWPSSLTWQELAP